MVLCFHDLPEGGCSDAPSEEDGSGRSGPLSEGAFRTRRGKVRHEKQACDPDGRKEVSLETIRPTARLIRVNWKTLVLFELSFKGAAATIITLLIHLGFRLAMSAMGFTYLTRESIGAFLFHPLTLLLILLLILLASYLYLVRAAGLGRIGVLTALALVVPFSTQYSYVVLYGSFYVPHIAITFVLLALTLRALKSRNSL